jgi:hypothetical protein
MVDRKRESSMFPSGVGMRAGEGTPTTRSPGEALQDEEGVQIMRILGQDWLGS